MKMPTRTLVLVAIAWACALGSGAQYASSPGEPLVEGVPPDEPIDVTGDGVPDLLITGTVDSTGDAELGLGGRYRRGVRTLPGTVVLQWRTHQHQEWYTLPTGDTMNPGTLDARFRSQQIHWCPGPVTFDLLERPFGPGLAPEADGWFGTGDRYEGTMILRSTAGPRPIMAAFTLWFTLPSGRIGVTPGQLVPVPVDFGRAGDPLPPVPKRDDPFSFDHEVEPQVVVPPGLPPDEPVDLVGDEAPEVILTGQEEFWHGTDRCGFFVRGLVPAPGTELLITRSGVGEPWDFYGLPSGTVFHPDTLTAGLARGTLHWAHPARGIFFRVLQHPFGLPDAPQEWSLVDPSAQGDLVYRTKYHGQGTVIGTMEVHGFVPGGELQVTGQNWVPEGTELQVR